VDTVVSSWKKNVSTLDWPYLMQMIIGKVLAGVRFRARVPKMVCELELGRMDKSELHTLQMRSRIASIGFAIRRRDDKKE